MPSKEDIAIFWFRRDLRLDDNTALSQALQSKYPVLPIFIFDTNILDRLSEKTDARIQFILDQVVSLKERLEEDESTLEIFHGQPDEVFKKLNEGYNIKEVYANKDYEPSAISRDRMIIDLLEAKRIPFYHFKDQVVFEGSEILKQDGTPFKVFSAFKRVWMQKLEISKEWEKTTKVDFSNFLRTKPAKNFDLKELGFQPSSIKIPGKVVSDQLIKNYDKTRDFPALNGTSRLGIHLRFGTISIRRKVAEAKQLNPTFLNELIWREFYSAILQHFPHVVDRAFNKKYDLIPWKNDPAQFELWCKGKTGFPIVDAGMRELNQSGYMHNRVRMIVASFLTKHLLIDWRWGEAYFAAKLLDYELASNNGGWQWAAGTGTDAQPYFRVFNPESQAQKFDQNKEYIKKWVPELETSSYPAPMVDHKSARQRAIETYKTFVSK
jgi:deoxyribodipyrimidine photo-lyase